MPPPIKQLLPLMAAMLLLLSVSAHAAAPNRLSVDFSSSLIASPSSTPASVQSKSVVHEHAQQLQLFTVSGHLQS
jgi:hypothetical protein